jgi:hypothetical protein
MVSLFCSEPFDGVLIPCRRALRDPRGKVKVHFGALRAHEQAVIPGLGALLLRQSAAKSRLLRAPIAPRDVHFSSPRIRFVLLTLHRWSRSARRRGMSTTSKGSEQNEGTIGWQYIVSERNERYSRVVFDSKISFALEIPSRRYSSSFIIFLPQLAIV